MKSKISIAFAILLAILVGCKKQSVNTKWVNPFIGTGAHGHTFPGASLPFGMVQLSPDTHNEGWDWCSGYHYSDSSIMGFSHTHLSGTGRGDLLDILVMPFSGNTQWDAGKKEDPLSGYRSKFSHKNEVSKPGYYSVILDDDNIKAELTSTTRVGFHKYTFAKDSSRKIILDLFHGLKSDSVIETSLKIIDGNTLIGYKQSRGWGELQERYWVNHTVYFAIKFSEAFKSNKTNADGIISDLIGTIKARSVKAIFEFEKTNKPLLVKVAISSTGTDGALLNLDSEISNWNFDKVANNANKIWENELSKIDIDADSSTTTIFYTAFYHSLLSPYTYSDVDGRYMGFDRKIHKSEKGVNFTALSLWDTFRANHPFFTIVKPEIVPGIINTMLNQFREYGSLPVWPLSNNETNCMIGYHSAPVIVDACFKGIDGFDIQFAYEALKKSATQDSFGINLIDKYGYLPSDIINKSVSRTLEYAYDDWCIAQLAQKLGYTNDYKYFINRSKAYKQVYDSKVNFARGKDSNGNFVVPFDPTYASYVKCDFVEGNAWQYSWFVPHDVNGLINLMGGTKRASLKLDSLFTLEATNAEGKPVDITGLIGEYAHGNEPSHHVAYLYNYLNEPQKTQARVHQILTTLYTDKPDGLCGNEDMGQMSAWYLFSAMGFYPVNPCGGVYDIGTPIIKSAKIKLSNGKVFEIITRNFSKNKFLIDKILLNNKNLSQFTINHTDILNGGKLEFFMK